MAMSSTLPPPGSPNVLYLIDLAGYVFRAYHAIAPLTNANGESTHATLGTTNMLVKLIADRKPRLLAVAMDSKGPSFRKAIDPNYKANRPPPPPDLSVQMERCRSIVAALGIPLFQQDGIEADDFIATVVRVARAQGIQVVIVSSDKDLMQLVSEDSVWQWDSMRNKVFGPAEVEEKFGVRPDQVRDYLALVGDSSDNVPGVPGIGPKTATELLRAHQTLAAIYANLDAVTKPRWRELLRDNHASATMSERLVTLKDDLPVDVDPSTLGWHGLADPSVDRAGLRAIFQELGFQRLLDTLPKDDAATTARGAANAASAEVTTGAATPAGNDHLQIVTTTAALEQLCVTLASAGAVTLATLTDDAGPMRAILHGMLLQTSGGPCHFLPTALLRSSAATPFLRWLNSSHPKVGHDLKTSEVHLRHHLGVAFLGLGGVCMDTLLASYLLEPEASHDFEAIAARLLDGETVPADPTPASIGTLVVDLQAADEQALLHRMSALTRMSPRLRDRLSAAASPSSSPAVVLDTLELPLSRILAEMEVCGVLVDAKQLHALSVELEQRIDSLQTQARTMARADLNLSSPKQLEVVLFDELGLKVSRKTKTGRSTDAEALEAIRDAHPLPALVLEYRGLTKLKGTYIDALPRLIHPETGRIHTRWQQAVAATGRISSQDPNLQNIPIRTDLGRLIRSAFIAPPGQVFLSADYSQIELRVLAHLSRDPSLLEAFRHNRDVHRMTAAALFHVAEDGVTADMRRQAKTVNFGVIYGMGEVALSKQLHIERKEAKRFIESYFERYAGVASFMEETLALARQQGHVSTLLGRIRPLPDLASSDPMRRSYAERIAQNTPIQGTAADILKLAMVRLRDPVVPGARMILTVHDELAFEVPEEQAEEAATRVKREMSAAFPLDVPLDVDARWGLNWGAAH
jgi:DNA polymerase-1